MWGAARAKLKSPPLLVADLNRQSAPPTSQPVITKQTQSARPPAPPVPLATQQEEQSTPQQPLWLLETDPALSQLAKEEPWRKTLVLGISANKPAPPPQPAAVVMPHASGENPGYYDAHSGKRIQIDLQLVYLSVEGAVTTRTVTVERFTHDGNGGALLAFCHLRHSRRTFLFSRIQSAVDTSTGEIIGHLSRWLDARYVETPEGKADAFLNRHDAALSAFMHIARADGAFRAREKACIKDFCSANGLEDEKAWAATIRELENWHVDTAIAYGRALRTTATMPRAYLEEVYATACSMVASDKKIYDSETHALKRMRREFGISDISDATIHMAARADKQE